MKRAEPLIVMHREHLLPRLLYVEAYLAVYDIDQRLCPFSESSLVFHTRTYPTHYSSSGELINTFHFHRAVIMQNNNSLYSTRHFHMLRNI